MPHSHSPLTSTHLSGHSSSFPGAASSLVFEVLDSLVDLCSWEIHILSFPLRRALPFLEFQLPLLACAPQVSSPGFSQQLRAYVSPRRSPWPLQASRCAPKSHLSSQPHTGQLRLPTAMSLQRHHFSSQHTTGGVNSPLIFHFCVFKPVVSFYYRSFP